MTTYLYLYTGEHGPISAVFLADDITEAKTTAAREAGDWYQDAEDVLGLPLDTPASEALFVAQLRGWQPVYPSNHSPFHLFTRP